MANQIHREAVVHGKVQGVWYRASTQQKATELGLVGWVCNQPDGTVRLVAEGPEVAVQALLDWCHVGPPHAVVSKVEVSAGEIAGFQTFEVLR